MTTGQVAHVDVPRRRSRLLVYRCRARSSRRGDCRRGCLAREHVGGNGSLGVSVHSSLAADAGYQGSPAWSPDGKTIAYVAEVDGVQQIFTRSLASSMRAQITRAPFECRDPFWSADGSRVFYTSLARDKDGLWSVSAGGGTPQIAMEDASDAAISPDGKVLAFFREETPFFKTLWFSSPAGAQPRKYTRPPFDSTGYTDATLRFSPDGSRLLIRALRGEPGRAGTLEAAPSG